MKRWIFLVAITGGAILRLLSLDLRPMHTDEAVHAVKFGTLLETGVYRYDPNEYHGPTLNYLTLIPASLFSELRFEDVHESTLRLVPALCGILILLLLLLLRDLGDLPVAIAMLMTAISPAMTFYSRYYIQETLLICFTVGLIAAGYQFFKTGRPVWAILAGGCLGLMHATKETSLLAVGAIVLALLISRVLVRGPGFRFPRMLTVLLFVSSACAVSIMLFSSFGSNWGGVADSILSLETYAARAGGDAGHEQAWDYYLRLLMWWKIGDGPVWSEAPFLLLAVVGFVSSLRSRPGAELTSRLPVVISLAAILLWVVYSVIPYKTPWSILGAYQISLIMGGVGTARILEWAGRGGKRAIASVAVAAVFLFAGWQSYRTNFVFFADPSNPFVYAHPGEDVKVIAERVKEAVRRAPGGEKIIVQVVCPSDDYWPLPWYFRGLKNVGWWNKVAEDFRPAPIILTSPEFEGEIIKRIYNEPRPGERHLYIPLFDRPMYLRPGREIRGYVSLELSQRTREQGR